MEEKPKEVREEIIRLLEMADIWQLRKIYIVAKGLIG